MTIIEILRAAVNDFEQHGFKSQEQIDEWIRLLKIEIAKTLKPAPELQKLLQKHLNAIYEKLVDRGKVLTLHPGVSRFTLQRIAPHLRVELDKRILASVNLIKLNREKMVNETLQRLSGWMTSIPDRGSKSVNKRETVENVAAPIRSLPYAERRVLIDQGHRLNASISAVIAADNGAIAARWASNFRQPGYDFREDHKERDGKVYLIRGSWAKQQGYAKVGECGYTDEIDQPSQKINCRCRYVYLYHLNQLPDDMLTEKGREKLKIRIPQSISKNIKT